MLASETIVADAAEFSLPNDFAPSREELIREVDSKTYQQVEGLNIEYRGDRIRMSGKSASYYVKQLATQALLSSLPAATLDNEILVESN